MRHARTIGIGLYLLTLAAWAAPAAACNVPVYQYALQNWAPDQYGVFLFYRGEADDGSKAAEAVLARARVNPDAPANLDVRLINLADEMPPGIGEIWKAQGNPPLPWMVVLPPVQYGVDPNRSIYSCPPAAAAAEALIDSPARRKIANAIRAGDAGVWVLLDSGDRTADDAAAAVLAKAIAQAGRVLEMPNPLDPYAYEQPMPPLAAEGRPASGAPDAGPQPAPQRPTFSMVRIARTDPAEKALLAMLANADPMPRKDEPVRPMAFLVFGLGRVSGPLIGEGIEPENILGGCDFVSGPCACNVKVDCPGVDLLVATNWSAPPPEPVAPATRAAEVTAEAAAGAGGLVRNIAVAAGVLVLAAGVAVVLVRRQTSGS